MIYFGSMTIAFYMIFKFTVKIFFANGKEENGMEMKNKLKNMKLSLSPRNGNKQTTTTKIFYIYKF